MRKQALILLLSTFIIQVLFSGQVVGIVIDEKTEDPLIGANIVIKDSNIGSASDEEGNFALFSVPSGEQIIMVSYIGYETIEKKIRVLPGGKKLAVTIKLSVSSI